MEFVFKATDDDGGTVTKTFSTEYLVSVIDSFDSFVRGCGFVPKGTIEDVEEKKSPNISESENPSDFADLFFCDT
jgi:hypothetical protein